MSYLHCYDGLYWLHDRRYNGRNIRRQHEHMNFLLNLDGLRISHVRRCRHLLSSVNNPDNPGKLLTRDQDVAYEDFSLNQNNN